MRKGIGSKRRQTKRSARKEHPFLNNKVEVVLAKQIQVMKMLKPRGTYINCCKGAALLSGKVAKPQREIKQATTAITVIKIEVNNMDLTRIVKTVNPFNSLSRK